MIGEWFRVEVGRRTVSGDVLWGPLREWLDGTIESARRARDRAALAHGHVRIVRTLTEVVE